MHGIQGIVQRARRFQVLAVTVGLVGLLVVFSDPVGVGAQSGSPGGAVRADDVDDGACVGSGYGAAADWASWGPASVDAGPGCRAGSS